jgi:outer membrane receptor for ferrienterochelin and colicin
LKYYNATQKSIYANYIYQSIIKTCEHKFKTGASFLLDNFDEHYNEPTVDYKRYITYLVPGVFGEYTYEMENKLTVVAGMRFDYHNYDGMFYTPRIHAKYNFTPNVILRASVGKSYRTANVISDNFGLLASSKVLHFNEHLNAEEAWNGGLNLTWKFRMLKRDATFNADAYRTEFINQVIFDAYSSNDYINVYNLNGKSFSQNFQVSLDYELIKNLDLRLAYKWDNVHVTYNDVLRDKPLVAQNKALLNLAYNFGNEKWRADFTTQWIGEKPLEYAQGNPSIEDNNASHSPDYFILNAQITKVFRHFEIYLGGENLTDFRQHEVIISADDAFSKSFDATDVWGPVTGRKFYAGIRTNFK